MVNVPPPTSPGPTPRTHTIRPKGGALNSALHPSYKPRNTNKPLVVYQPPGYASIMPPAYCGACTDNALHEDFDVPPLL